MNRILIQDRGNIFAIFWQRELKADLLLFVAGGHYGDAYEYGLRQAERRAEEFREKHDDIGDIVFKKMK